MSVRALAGVRTVVRGETVVDKILSPANLVLLVTSEGTLVAGERRGEHHNEVFSTITCLIDAETNLCVGRIHEVGTVASGGDTIVDEKIGDHVFNVGSLGRNTVRNDIFSRG